MTLFRQLCLDAKLPQEKIELLVPFLVTTYGNVDKFLDDVEAGGPVVDRREVKWPKGIRLNDLHRLRLAALAIIVPSERMMTLSTKTTSFKEMCHNAKLSEEKVELLVPFLIQTYGDERSFLRNVASGGPVMNRREVNWPEEIDDFDLYQLRLSALEVVADFENKKYSQCCIIV